VVIWCLYFTSLAGFHFGEFFVTSIFNPWSLSYDAFIINHSKEYTVAAIASWIEFWVERFTFPGLKLAGFQLGAGGGGGDGGGEATWWMYGACILSGLGLVLVLVGQACRSGAMWTAGSNFNHVIATKKEKEHQLVTHGLYRYLRHPSYFGWFWWSIGLQVLLLNPVCTLAYAAASWRFFSRRIPFEEGQLEKFFPDYPAYKRRTIIGIPFI